MFINASKNFNLNITWATSFTGEFEAASPPSLQHFTYRQEGNEPDI